MLIAALIGGGVYGILLLVRGSGGKVKVYPIMEFCTDYADDQAETQGLVKPDKMQSIYVSETQKITKYYVREGDTVKEGGIVVAGGVIHALIGLSRPGRHPHEAGFQRLFGYDCAGDEARRGAFKGSTPQ